MQRTEFTCLGTRVALWAHPDPDHLGRAIREGRGFYEADVLLRSRELYLPGTVVVDAGANIGNHTVFFAAILGAHVEAFEPFASNRTLLEMNVAENALDDRVRIHAAALGAAAAFGTAIPGRPGNAGTASVRVGDGDVPVVTLDDLDLDGPVGLIKIDVEGSECAVLQGAAATIARDLPDIVVEADGDAAFRDAARLLHTYGYVPAGRYAWTPTYVFHAADQRSRMARLLA